ncbi:sialate O-acetylesterase [Pedobacter sp. MW01-1-1]|uniref:sialate O-acetylesterase n=1 Tax=Pedobacter sp. MW01-1-1 TaxID=3383027 RepID=UPI003FF07A53
MMKRIQLTFLIILFASFTKASVKLPALIGNGMVLQRDKKITVWGWAEAGEQIHLTFKNKTYKTKADRNQYWSVIIDAQKAGGPYIMHINTITLEDLLIGDVWLCAGQSNMEAVMNRSNIRENYPAEIKQSNYPFIRQFTVKRDMAFNPLLNVSSEKGWVTAKPETVLNFSAVAYFFAKDLYEKYKIPIGIINSSVGGTPIQSWVDSESLKPFPEYYKLAQKYKDTALVTQILKEHTLKSENWYSSIRNEDKGVIEKWFSQDEQRNAGWQKIQDLSKLNEKFNTPIYGSMWFKTSVEIPKNLVGKAATISLGVMQTEDETYLNGQKIGSINSSYTERNYSIEPGILKEGKNTITIRLISPTTGILIHQNEGYQIKFANQSIAINSGWSYQFGIKKEYLPKGNGLSLHSPTAYYYSMIKPLSKFSIKGIVWYQGESNVSKPEEYHPLLTSLISQWRNDWQQASLPFLYVQLANYCSTPTEPAVSNWALLREAQMKTLNVPNTAMVVIHDIGERNDIHPKNKLDVGKRLALAARNVAYHEKIISSGPLFKSVSIQKNRVLVTFDHFGNGLMCKGTQLHTFELSDDGNKFVAANAKIVNNQVFVWSDSVTKPIAVRYAWADSPDSANLYNKEGLPASSFRSNLIY